MISEGLVVKQTTLDVDSWICRILPLVLKDKQYNYHCLCDYNVKVIEVSNLPLLSTRVFKVLVIIIM